MKTTGSTTCVKNRVAHILSGATDINIILEDNFTIKGIVGIISIVGIDLAPYASVDYVSHETVSGYIDKVEFYTVIYYFRHIRYFILDIISHII